VAVGGGRDTAGDWTGRRGSDNNEEKRGRRGLRGGEGHFGFPQKVNLVIIFFLFIRMLNER